MLHIRQGNEKAATQEYRLTKVEEILAGESQARRKTTDTDKLHKRVMLPPAIAEVFSLSELRLFVHKLGGDYENLEGETKNDKALSLVLWMQRNGRFRELLIKLGAARPRVDWQSFK